MGRGGRKEWGGKGEYASLALWGMDATVHYITKTNIYTVAYHTYQFICEKVDLLAENYGIPTATCGQ